MGPFIPPKPRPALDEGVTVTFNNDLLTFWRRRWEAGICPCGCTLTLSELRRAAPRLLERYETHWDWDRAMEEYNAR